MEITLELSDLVVMQSKCTMSRVFHKKCATGLPVSKTLIKYICNSSEENDEEEKDPIDIKFTEQNADSEMMKILLNLNDLVYKMKMRKILLWLT